MKFWKVVIDNGCGDYAAFLVEAETEEAAIGIVHQNQAMLPVARELDYLGLNSVPTREWEVEPHPGPTPPWRGIHRMGVFDHEAGYASAPLMPEDLW